MVTIETTRKIALSLTGTTEQDHFGKPSFRVNNSIYATLWLNENRVMVKLSLIDQSVFNSFDPLVFYPVPNKWGLGGATFVELAKVRQDMLTDALQIAWKDAANKKKRKS